MVADWNYSVRNPLFRARERVEVGTRLIQGKRLLHQSVTVGDKLGEAPFFFVNVERCDLAFRGVELPASLSLLRR